MKPLRAHRASQPILVFISINVFFHTVTACASKLRERMEIMVYAPASFFSGICLAQRSLLFDRKKTDRQNNRQTNARHTLDSYQVWSIF